MTLHDLQLQVHPGDGIVASLDTAAVVLPGEAEHRDFAERLLGIVRSGCEQYGPTPGRPVIRKLAGLVMGAEPAEVAPFSVVADAEDGLAIMLCGSMELELTTDSGEEALSGREVATWVDRVIRAPVHRLAVFPTGGRPGRLHTDIDLRLGVVLGSGMTLSPAGTAGDRRGLAGFEAPPVHAVTGGPQPAPTRARSRGSAAIGPPRGEPPRAPEADAAEAPEAARVADAPEAPEAAHVAEATGAPAPPPGRVLPPLKRPPQSNPKESSFVSIAFAEPLPAEELHPLPVAGGGPAGPGPASAEHDGPVVQGIVCARGHFNDPNARFCALCGIAMVQQTHNLVSGARPPLGVLVLDDGATFVVDGSYVIGREPEVSDLVRTGQARPLAIDDSKRRLSRVHAVLLVVDWELRVEDAGSRNGTRILRPDSSDWQQLSPEEPTPIEPGTRIGVGGRELVFDSHFGAN